MTEHTLLEITTGRDNERGAEAALQLFSALPVLRDNFVYRLLKKDERLSFEIALIDQLVTFYIYVPVRLVEYIKSLVLANYPEAQVSHLTPHTENQDPTYIFTNLPASILNPPFISEPAIRVDAKPAAKNPNSPVTKPSKLITAFDPQHEPISSPSPSTPSSLTLSTKLNPPPTPPPLAESLLSSPPNHLMTAHFDLRYQEFLPLKDYREFGDADSLSALLSVLSKAKKDEQAIIQFTVQNNDLLWRTMAPEKGSEAKLTASDDGSITTAVSSGQRSLIDVKLKEKALDITLRVAVTSASQTQSQLFLENIFHAFQVLHKENSNYLKIKRPIFTSHQKILQQLQSRAFSHAHHFHVNVYELATLWHLPNKTLSTIPNLAWGKTLLGEPPENLPIVRKDYPLAVKKEINVFAQTIFKNETVNYGITRADRRRHMYVIGKTGTGKSTMLANMAVNDLRNNEGFCFIDPHGDAIETLLDYIPSHRINDVVYFNPADGERTVKINLFEGKNIEHRELIASGIVSIFQKLYAYTWGPRLEHFLRNALLTLLQSEEARMSDIITLFTNTKFRKKVVAELKDPVLKSFWQGEFEPLQDRQRNEAIAPILNKVGQFVSSPLVRNVVNSTKSSFNIEDIMDEGKILLVNLSQGRLGEDNATLLGAMMITKIQLAAMGRVNIPEEQRRDFYLYVDEFQNFATDSFTKILSEARKYRLSLVLANQYIAQIPEEVRQAIFGNCGTMASFVMGSEDAEIFSKEYGGKYTPDDLISLNRHQIINRITIDNIISHPFSAYTLPLAKNTNHNREKVIKVSRERYASDKE